MTAVFNNTQKYGGSFSAKYSTVAFSGYTEGHLSQQVQFQYQQQVTMLYELGSSSVYYVGGRAQGTATISKLVGPKGLNIASLYQDICSPGSITITQNSGCASSTPANGVVGPASANSSVVGTTYDLQNAVLTSLSGTQTAQDVVFTETMSFMFLNLDMKSQASVLAA